MSRYKINPKPGDVYLIPGDMHFPMEDAPAVATMQSWYEEEYRSKPKYRTGVILQGDTIDPFGLSRFPKAAKKAWDVGRLMNAVDKVRPFLEWAADDDLGCEMIEGNHEGWIREAFDTMPALDGLPGLELGALTGLDDIDGLQIFPEKTKIVLSNKVVVAHGHDLGAKTAKTIMARYPNQYTILGHYHSVYSDSRTVYGPDGRPSYRGVACVGMLADLAQIEYADDPDMQLGFGTLEFFGDRGGGRPFFKVSTHYIVRGEDGVPHVA